MVRLLKQSGGRPLVRYHGPFRIALNGISRNLSLTFGTEVRESAYLQSQIDVEPGAEILGVWLPPVLDEMVDDRGKSLEDSLRVNHHFSLAGKRRSFNASLRLAPPHMESKSIKSLKAHFRFAVASAWDELALPLPQKGDENPEAQRGELRARVASRTEANGQLTFRIELWRELVYADDERRRPVPEQSFQFVDSQGRTVAPLGRVMRQQQTDREIFTLRVPAQELDRLEIRSLRSMEVRRMSFAFEDVPLR